MDWGIRLILLGFPSKIIVGSAQSLPESSFLVLQFSSLLSCLWVCPLLVLFFFYLLVCCVEMWNDIGLSSTLCIFFFSFDKKQFVLLWFFAASKNKNKKSCLRIFIDGSHSTILICEEARGKFSLNNNLPKLKGSNRRILQTHFHCFANKNRYNYNFSFW